jgi:hypothetical protein
MGRRVPNYHFLIKSHIQKTRSTIHSYHRPLSIIIPLRLHTFSTIHCYNPAKMETG